MAKQQTFQGYVDLKNKDKICFFQLGKQFKETNPSLLFVHGNFSNKQWWYDTIQHLSNLKYHIVAVDQRGFGKSSYNTKCATFLQWASDLKQVCQWLNIKKCIAIGWSFGGGVCMKFAQIAPQIVQKIILTCSVAHDGLCLITNGKPCKSRDEIIQNTKSKFMLELIQSKNIEAMTQVFDSVLLTYVKNFPVQKKNKLLKSPFEQRSYIDVLYALANSDIKIENIKIPALMIHGKLDLVVTLQSVKNTGNYLKNFIIWQNNGHMIPLENPQQYQKLIIQFINK